MSRAIDVRGARDAASTLENRAKIEASIVQPVWTPHASAMVHTVPDWDLECPTEGWHSSAKCLTQTGTPVPSTSQCQPDGWHSSTQCQPVPASRMALQCPVPAYLSPQYLPPQPLSPALFGGGDLLGPGPFLVSKASIG